MTVALALRDGFLAIEQWVVDPLAAERTTQGRAAFRFACGIAPWGYFFAALFAAFDAVLLVGSLVAAATAALLVGPVLRVSRSTSLAAHWVNLGLLQSFLIPSWLLGGIETASFPWLGVTVVVATFVGGVTDGVVWVLISWLATWGLYGAHVLGNVPEPMLSDEVTWWLAACGHSGLFAVVLAFVVAVVTVQRRARAELETARAEAEVASDAKSLFLANMSHELRTPLNAIIGYTELLLESARSETDREDLNRIAHAGHHLLGLINDVLDLSKVEAGEMVFNIEPVDVVSLVRGVLDASQPLVAARGNTARFWATAEVWAMADEVRLKQCLLNLVGNAAKFTEGGTIDVEVARQGNRVRLVVADTGRGMSEAELARAFQPFTQANDEVQRTHGGTGLGLALVHDFVHHMGGRIEASSAPGQGSTFVLELRAAP